jgi:hypothetical protein
MALRNWSPSAHSRCLWMKLWTNGYTMGGRTFFFDQRIVGHLYWLQVCYQYHNIGVVKAGLRFFEVLRYSVHEAPIKVKTKCYSQVVSTPALYSGGPRSKSWAGDQQSWLQFFIVFIVPPSKCQDSTLNYATGASFHFPSISLSIYCPIIWHCSLSYWQYH